MSKEEKQEKQKKPKKHYSSGFRAPDGTYLIEQIVDDTGTVLLRYNTALHPDGESEAPFPIDDYEYRGIKYHPFPADNGTLKCIKMPTDAVEYGSTKQLFDEICAFIHTWAQMEEISESLAAYYVLFSWVYDDFDEVPYLRILADLGSGKSRLAVRVLGAIAYKPMCTIGVSSLSAIFRGLDSMHGTLVVDEADFGDKSDKTNELVQLLNTGYISDVAILRSESKGGNNFESQSFKVFGPKIIASRESMKDHALESRCLPVSMAELTRTDVPLLTDNRIHTVSQDLRNKLLMFRFRNSGNLHSRIDYSFASLSLQPRTKQLLLLISSVIDDPQMKEQLRTYAQQMNTKNLDRRSDTFEAELIMAMCEFMNRENFDAYTSGYFIPTQLIVNKLNEEKEGNFDKFTTKSVGKAIKTKLNLEGDRAMKKGVNQRGIKFTYLQISNLCQHYGLPIPPVVNDPLVTYIPDALEMTPEQLSEEIKKQDQASLPPM
jgi:hypothetical protein